MNETVGTIHANRLAQAYSLAAARGWVLSSRPISLAELAASRPLAERESPRGGIEQGTALIAHFVRRERLVLPAAIVMVGGRELLDWARFNVERSAPAIAREMFGNADGDSVLILTAGAMAALRQ
jgi:hypothetical protein